MANINAVIVPAKALTGGRHKVRISVSHNGEFRYIPTDIVIDSLKEFKNGQVVKRPDSSFLNTKLRGILQRYQSIIDEMEYINGLSCSELVFELKHKLDKKSATLKDAFDQYITTSSAKESTKQLYAGHFKAITKILGKDMPLRTFNHTTVAMLDKEFKKFLNPNTLSNYMAFLSSLIKFAQRCGMVYYEFDPFFRYKRTPLGRRESWLTVDEIRTIRDYEPKTNTIKIAKDMFMLSYYLGGINMVDLESIDFNENSDVLRYVRIKTEGTNKINKYVEFEIPQEAKEIINRHIGPNGKLVLQNAKNKYAYRHGISHIMKKLANRLGFDNMVYYSARKSFAQHAFDIGISESVIDYILGHKINKTSTSLYSYISVTPQMATDAIKKVLANLK